MFKKWNLWTSNRSIRMSYSDEDERWRNKDFLLLSTKNDEEIKNFGQNIHTRRSKIQQGFLGFHQLLPRWIILPSRTYNWKTIFHRGRINIDEIVSGTQYRYLLLQRGRLKFSPRRLWRGLLDWEGTLRNNTNIPHHPTGPPNDQRRFTTEHIMHPIWHVAYHQSIATRNSLVTAHIHVLNLFPNGMRTPRGTPLVARSAFDPYTSR